MGAAQKIPAKDADGNVIGIDVVRRFPPNAGAAADRAESALNAINPAAFTPFGHAGEPQDPPEPWPSDKTATEYPPPNCDGFGHEPTQSGQALARCSYPDCNCPFDHPGIKGWCARGFATDEYPGGYKTASEGGEYRAALQFESAAGDLNPDACRSGVCTTE